MYSTQRDKHNMYVRKKKQFLDNLKKKSSVLNYKNEGWP